MDRHKGKEGGMTQQQIPGEQYTPAAASAAVTPSEESSVRPPIIERVVRPQDADPASARRSERIIAGFFLLSALGTIGFIAAYVAIQMHSLHDTALSNRWLGVALGVSLGGLAIGIIAWVRWLMPAHETVQDRHELASDEDTLDAAAQVVMVGIEETGLTRRKLLGGTLALSSGLLALPAVVLLRDLGPLPRNALRTTLWTKGAYMLNAESGKPVKLGDLDVGSFTTVLPKKAEDMSEEEYAKASVLIIRLEPGLNQPLPGREDWAYQDHVAYSKICTHLGCPIGLYEKQVHQLLCPCHQSTFDVPKACNVIFGPAARRLPQLPITVDGDGYFRAASGFQEPVGPSFWERG